MNREELFWTVISRTVMCVLAFCLFAASAVSAKGSAAPSTEALLRLLTGKQALALDTASVEKGCDIRTPEGKIHTLGDYLAHLTSALIPENGQNQVTSSCKALKGGRQACEVWFSTGGGTDSPWRYGVQFQRDPKGELDPASLRCPGTP